MSVIDHPEAPGNVAWQAHDGSLSSPRTHSEMARAFPHHYNAYHELKGLDAASAEAKKASPIVVEQTGRARRDGGEALGAGLGVLLGKGAGASRTAMFGAPATPMEQAGQTTGIESGAALGGGSAWDELAKQNAYGAGTET